MQEIIICIIQISSTSNLKSPRLHLDSRTLPLKIPCVEILCFYFQSQFSYVYEFYRILISVIYIKMDLLFCILNNINSILNYKQWIVSHLEIFKEELSAKLNN